MHLHYAQGLIVCNVRVRVRSAQVVVVVMVMIRIVLDDPSHLVVYLLMLYDSSSFYTVLVLCYTQCSYTVLCHASPLHNLFSHAVGCSTHYFCTTLSYFVLHSYILN